MWADGPAIPDPAAALRRTGYARTIRVSSAADVRV
jgi:hypothetical protein